MQTDTNYGYSVLNPATCDATATIAVTGVGRSGTTMIARILAEIGLPIGDELSPQFLEDQAILGLLKKGRLTDFEELCRRRDRKHSKWGFKCPALRIHLIETHAQMHNPRYIVPFRDVVAIAQRNHLALGMTMDDALGLATRSYHKFVRDLMTLKAPILAISYEKTLQYPEQIVQAVAEFCDLPLTPARVRSIAAKTVRNGDPRYLSPDPAPDTGPA